MEKQKLNEGLLVFFACTPCAITKGQFSTVFHCYVWLPSQPPVSFWLYDGIPVLSSRYPQIFGGAVLNVETHARLWLGLQSAFRGWLGWLRTLSVCFEELVLRVLVSTKLHILLRLQSQAWTAHIPKDPVCHVWQDWGCCLWGCLIQDFRFGCLIQDPNSDRIPPLPSTSLPNRRHPPEAGQWLGLHEDYEIRDTSHHES